MGTSTTPLYFLSRFTEVRVNTALWGGVGGVGGVGGGGVVEEEEEEE